MSLTRSKAEVTALKTAEEFKNAVQKMSQTKVVVIDLHEEWCGANVAIMQFYTQMWLEFPEPDNRIQLYSISKEIPELNDTLKLLCPTVKAAAQGCKPLFLVFRLGTLMEAVDGVNAPALKSVIATNVPKLAPKE